MAHGELVWCDLSARQPAQVMGFYTDVFGWAFDKSESYFVAHRQGQEVAGLFEMPTNFQAVGLPSFWMTYVSTDDLDQTCTQAKALGGTVEIGPNPFGENGAYALIRDPLGAGFTAYQGDLDVPTQHKDGCRLGHGLFVSDASKIRAFYEGLFDWQFDSTKDGVAAVRKDQQIVFYCHEINDAAVRGKEQYWAVYFDTDYLASSLKTVANSGGSLIANITIPEGQAAFVSDPEGAVFVLVDRSAGTGLMDALLSLEFIGWAVA